MKRRKVRIGGIEATVVSDAEAEKCDIRLCAYWDAPARFEDDVKALCAGCGVALRHRPYGPNRPMKLCAPCAIGWSTKH